MNKNMATRLRVKNADVGEVELVFATMKVIDHDGDVILPGSIDEGAEVVVSAYGHESWKGKLPVGRGTIHEDGDELVAKIRFFLDTTHGLDTFNTVKALAGDGGEMDLTEWSFSLQEVTATKGVWDGKRANLIERIGRIKEVSPVLAGAGIGTGTRAVKSIKQLESSLSTLLYQAGRALFPRLYVWVADYDVDDGFVVYSVESWEEELGYTATLYQVGFTRTDTSVDLIGEPVEVHRSAVFTPKSFTFSEHAAQVMAGVDALTHRAAEVVALRAEKGKSISDESADCIRQIGDALDRLKTLVSPTTTTTGDDTDGATAEWLRFVAASL